MGCNRSLLITLLIWLVIWCVLSTTETKAGGNASKATALNTKIRAIEGLRAQLTAKKETAGSIREQLHEQAGILVDEIKEECTRRKTRTWAKAADSPRIAFNVKLLQRLRAYMDQIDQRLLFFKQADAEMAYLSRQASDEVKIIETTIDMDITHLLERIDQILTHYQPQVEQEIILIEKVKLPAAERIWETWVRKK